MTEHVWEKTASTAGVVDACKNCGRIKLKSNGVCPWARGRDDFYSPDVVNPYSGGSNAELWEAGFAWARHDLCNDPVIKEALERHG